MKTQATERSNAPEVHAPAVIQAPAYVPQPKSIERQGRSTAPAVHHMPEIRGGICEWCGVIDKNVPSQFQYQLCPHFRGMGEIRCSYCDEALDPQEVTRRAVLHITDHPYNPNQVVVVCNSYECSKKHLERFTVGR